MPLFQIFRRLGLVDTHWPLILVPIFGAPSVFATFVMRQFFIALPVELEEAARVDGWGALRSSARSRQPLARPALASVAIFTFLHSWNLYLEPIVFSSANICTTAAGAHHFTDAYGGPLWNVQLAAATLTALPVLIVLWWRKNSSSKGSRTRDSKDRRHCRNDDVQWLKFSFPTCAEFWPQRT